MTYSIDVAKHLTNLSANDYNPLDVQVGDLILLEAFNSLNIAEVTEVSKECIWVFFLFDAKTGNISTIPYVMWYPWSHVIDIYLRKEDL